jgi:hypothetical protein
MYHIINNNKLIYVYCNNITILSLKMDSSHPYKSGEQTYWAYVMPMEDDSYKSKGKHYSAVILKK